MSTSRTPEASPFVVGAAVVLVGWNRGRVSYRRAKVARTTPSGKFYVDGSDTMWSPANEFVGDIFKTPRDREWQGKPPRSEQRAVWGWSYHVVMSNPTIEAEISKFQEGKALAERYNNLRSKIGEAGALTNEQMDIIEAVLDPENAGKVLDWPRGFNEES